MLPFSNTIYLPGHGRAVLPTTAVPRHLRAGFRLLSVESFPRRRVGTAVGTRGMLSARPGR